MKALSIIESAYRGTLEEQDDTIVWLTHAMKGAGADLAVLLRGNAVNYGVNGQDSSGLVFGDRSHKHSAHIAEDISGLMAKGVEVMIVKEDVADRGLDPADMIGGMTAVPRDDIAKIFDAFDQVWHW